MAGRAHQKEEKILREIETILDHLIKNAEKMREISLHVISVQELDPLQKKQEELIYQLEQLDATFKEAFPGSSKISTKLTKQIESRLQQFQRLNAQFIENLTSSKGIIQLEKQKKAK